MTRGTASRRRSPGKRNRIARIAVSLLTVTLALWVETDVAGAASYQVRLINTGGQGVRPRAEPRADSPNVAGLTYGPGEGSTLGGVCQIRTSSTMRSGSYDNYLWHKVEFRGYHIYVNDTFTDSPSRNSQYVSGWPICGQTTPPNWPPGASVFFSGKGSAGASYASSAKASYIMTQDGSYNDRWTSSGCGTTEADDYPEVVGQRRITTLAGHSNGRLGPLYVLAQGGSRRAAANYILMFDPGSYGEMGCDRAVSAEYLLANWLGSNNSNRLVIMAGAATAPNRHEGIQRTYFRVIKERGLNSRVLVCNVTKGDGYWSHDDVIRGYAWMISQPPPTACPSGFLGWRP